MQQSTERKVILAMQMTLDGFIAGADGEMDWLIDSEEEWAILFKELESVDTFLLGRKMFPEYSGYWRKLLTQPSDNANSNKYAKIANETPHIVFSSTIQETDWANTTIAKDAAETIRALKKQPGKNMILWGGAQTAASLIDLGLIDEYRITLNPVLLAAGKPLFLHLTERRPLQLIDSHALPDGLIILRYKAG